MKSVIAYYRVSTARQGRSGLGLEAQKAAVESFCAREGFSIAHTFTDIESGTKDNRTGLVAALATSKNFGQSIVVAKLDRLGRSVHFISGLMAHNVDFIVAELGRNIPSFCLHLFAAVAEVEAKMISERTSAAMLVASRQRGVKLGTALPEVAAKVLPSAWAGSKAKGARTVARLSPSIAAAFADGCVSNGDVASYLNAREVLTTTGKAWTKQSIARYVRIWKTQQES